jgi:hypothetical protein
MGETGTRLKQAKPLPTAATLTYKETNAPMKGLMPAR